MNEVFLKIVSMSISASWLVAAVLIMRLVLKKAPKWMNVLLWGVVALRLVLPFSIESAASLIPDSVGSGELVEEWTDAYVGEVEIYQENTTEYNAIVAAGVEPVYNGNGGYYVVDEPPTVGEAVLPVLSVIWAAGMALLLLYTAVSYLRLRRRVSAAVRLRGNVYQSENAASPFVLGILRPRIYLPFAMGGQDMEHVIAHEQAHIRRKDHWWKPLGFLLLAVYWFNPLMWLAYVLLCRDIELACDEKVIKELGSEQRADYTQALLSCSVNRRMIAACPLAFGEVGVKARVRSVMNYKKPAFWIIIAALLACAAVAVCFLTNPKPPKELSLNIGEASMIRIFSGECGETVEITDAEDIKYLTDNINSMKFIRGKRVGNVDGFRYSTSWLDASGGVIDAMIITDEYNIRYDDYHYSGMEADNAIDYGFIESFFYIEYYGHKLRRSELSAETIEWLEKYNSMSEEERLAMSSVVPAELVAYIEKLSAGIESFYYEGTTFWYAGESYDLARSSPMLSAITGTYIVGEKIVVSADMDAEHGAYFVFDVAEREFTDIIEGSFLIWHSDDISTAVYANVSAVVDTVCAYGEMSLAEFLLAEGENISGLSFADDKTSLYVSISDTDGGERTERVYLPGYSPTADKSKPELDWKTLNELVMRKKGTATWSDFEEYYSESIGFGLNVLRYPISDRSHYLYIGDGSMDEPPKYIQLRSTSIEKTYIDLYSLYDHAGDNVLGPLLSLEKLGELAEQRGEALSWSDFEEYSSYSIEFSANGERRTLHYPLDDERFYLRVFGNVNEQPEGVWLVAASSFVNIGKYIDVRYDDVDEFIADDAAEDSIIGRMASLKIKDIDYISAFSDISARDLAAALNDAAGRRTDEVDAVGAFYSATVYLSEEHSSYDEHFIIYAGTNANFVEVKYYDGKGGHTDGFFYAEKLYWLIRNSCRIDERIDEAAYAEYRDIIEARAQESIDNSGEWVGASAFTGYVVTRFVPEDSFEAYGSRYDIYSWDVAFTTDEPSSVGWAGGMYLDYKGRVGAYEQYTYFAVKTDADGSEEHRFLHWDLYWEGLEPIARRRQSIQDITWEFGVAPEFSYVEEAAQYKSGDPGVRYYAAADFAEGKPGSIAEPRTAAWEAQELLRLDANDVLEHYSSTVYRDEEADMWKVVIARYTPGESWTVYIRGDGVPQFTVQGE